MNDNLSRLEAQQRAQHVNIHEYFIDLDVRDAVLDTPYFDVLSRINLHCDTACDTFLDFVGHEVSAVAIDGIPQPIVFDGARIAVQLPSGDHSVSVRARGVYSTSGEGLHRFTDPEDNETYLYSQFEPADARRVFPNIEQPDMKAQFTISIAAPAHWIALSNRSAIHVESCEANSAGMACQRHSFAQTKRMSTYLTAFIAGPYHRFTDQVDVDGQQIDLGFYCRKTLAQYFDFDDISTVTKQGLRLLPHTFDYPYPWGKYDSVFVPEYNLGAMENPGCVTFCEDSYIFRGESTRAQRAGRANTILHEMSHMWFGDLVTPQWWDDLWLKESFAEFMGAWASVQATQYVEAWENFAGSRLMWALKNDQYPTTHPIVADIPDLEAADQAFDGITYAKGAAVLRQLVAWVGEEAFFAGARQLFRKHEFANATLADFLDALSSVSGRDVRTWAAQWLETAGVSTVQIEREESGVRLTQIGDDPLTATPIRRPHRLRLSRWTRCTGGEEGDSRNLTRRGSCEIELVDSVVVPWEELGGRDCELLLANDESLSYIKIALDPQSVAAALECELDNPLSRSVLSGTLWNMVRDGRLDPSTYLNFVLNSAPDTPSDLLNTRLSTALSALRSFTDCQVRTQLLDEFFTRGCAVREEATGDSRLIWTRILARIGESLPHRAEQLRAILSSVTDADVQWKYLTALAAIDAIDQAELDAQLARTGAACDVVAHREAVASLPGHCAHAFAEIRGGKLSNDHVSALIDAMVKPLRYAERCAAVGDYFAMVNQVWADHSQEIAERIIYGLYPFSDDVPGEENVQERAARQWLNSVDAAPALRKVILDCHDDHLRMLRAQRAYRATA
ncbi:aminopeptidase N [Trueperella sp. LYQ143]|uniref:aminopeptidase N n=1 Tax=unclassified Trueperella TaxID=2630174 RepID=UPI0039838E3D